jgi:hypothetical protein
MSTTSLPKLFGKEFLPDCSVISVISINVIGSKNGGVYTNEGSEISIVGGTVNSFTRYEL